MGTMKGLAAAFALLFAVAAHAQAADSDAAATAEAKRHFENASKAFNLGEFKRAAEEYKSAYNLRSDPLFLYNIG